IREAEFEIKNKTEAYEATAKNVDFSKGELDAKKQELETITSETQKDEDKLVTEVEKSERNIDDRLLKVIKKLRKSFRNGLAVVSIERDSCSGCHSKIPPQLQSEIRQRKKIIICEHCGRILGDEEMAAEDG